MVINFLPTTDKTVFLTTLLGDASASMNASEAEVDARVHEALETEDLDILIDLRHQNTNQSDKYEVFWTHALSE